MVCRVKFVGILFASVGFEAGISPQDDDFNTVADLKQGLISDRSVDLVKHSGIDGVPAVFVDPQLAGHNFCNISPEGAGALCASYCATCSGTYIAKIWLEDGSEPDLVFPVQIGANEVKLPLCIFLNEHTPVKSNEIVHVHTWHYGAVC